MKIARATEQDIEALQQLAVLIEHPSAQLFDEDDPQNFNEANPEHLTILWDKIVDISRHGYLTRAAMNLSALLDPDNEILDFEQSALELSPKLQQGLDDTKRLDWLADRDQHIGNVQLPAECVACNLHSLRDAIDMAMRMQPENDAETQAKES